MPAQPPHLTAIPEKLKMRKQINKTHKINSLIIFLIKFVNPFTFSGDSAYQKENQMIDYDWNIFNNDTRQQKITKTKELYIREAHVHHKMKISTLNHNYCMYQIKCSKIIIYIIYRTCRQRQCFLQTTEPPATRNNRFPQVASMWPQNVWWNTKGRP